MSSQTHSADRKRVKEVLDSVLSDADNAPIRRYVSGNETDRNLTYSDWITPIVESGGELCLRVPSAEGAHFIRYRPGGPFKAVYAGPHGPENRPADIDEENIRLLIEWAQGVQICLSSDTPFTALEVQGDA